MEYYLGIDLGGSKIAIGIVDEGYKMLSKLTVKTPKNVSYNIIGDTIAKGVKELLDINKLTNIDIIFGGIACPGTVDAKKGTIIFACNLNLRDVPLATYVSDLLGIKLYICSDSGCASFGEYIAGASKDYKSSVTITLGTGVGCGIILNNTLLQSEGGHGVMIKDGLPCMCGRNGCFESYGSVTALINQTKQAMLQNKNSKLWTVAKTLDEVNGKTVFDGMDLGDETAIFLFNQYVAYLACGITNIVNMFLPEIVCIGGGISAQGERLIAPIRTIVHKEQFKLLGDICTRIEACELGNDAGIIGSALFGKYN